MKALFIFFTFFCFFNQEAENTKVIPMDNTFTETSSTNCLNVHGFSKLFDQSGCSFGCDLATSEFHECLISQMDLYETERKRVFTSLGFGETGPPLIGTVNPCIFHLKEVVVLILTTQLIIIFHFFLNRKIHENVRYGLITFLTIQNYLPIFIVLEIILVWKIE